MFRLGSVDQAKLNAKLGVKNDTALFAKLFTEDTTELKMLLTFKSSYLSADYYFRRSNNQNSGLN